MTIREGWIKCSRIATMKVLAEDIDVLQLVTMPNGEIFIVRTVCIIDGDITILGTDGIERNYSCGDILEVADDKS